MHMITRVELGDQPESNQEKILTVCTIQQKWLSSLIHEYVDKTELVPIGIIMKVKCTLHVRHC